MKSAFLYYVLLQIFGIINIILITLVLYNGTLFFSSNTNKLDLTIGVAALSGWAWIVYFLIVSFIFMTSLKRFFVNKIVYMYIKSCGLIFISYILVYIGFVVDIFKI